MQTNISKEESLKAYQILKDNHMLNYFVIISLLSHHFESGEESTNKQRELLWNDLAEIMLTLEDRYVKKVNAYTWDFILIGFAKNGKIEIMLELLEIARIERVKLNRKTLSVVLNALANDSNIGKVEEIYYSMDDFGIIPDSVHFNILIKALIKVGEIEEALDRFKQNEKIIDSNTFVLLLKGCADTKSINYGYQLYESILHNRELSQNIQILSCLINMFTKLSDYKKSIELFQKLLNKNQVDTITWTTIISAYHKEERLEEIENLLTINC